MKRDRLAGKSVELSSSELRIWPVSDNGATCVGCPIASYSMHAALYVRGLQDHGLCLPKHQKYVK